MSRTEAGPDPAVPSDRHRHARPRPNFAPVPTDHPGPGAWGSGTAPSRPTNYSATTYSAVPSQPTIRVRPEVFDACLVAMRQMEGGSLTSVGVTSTLSGEGRSTIATAIAAVQALHYERKTILVELDLARPTAARQFSLAEAPGVADILRGEKSIDECMQQVGDQLTVVVGGRRSGPGEQFRGAGTEGLVSGWTALAEVVVFDLPPLAPGAGGMQLVDLCQAVVMVVRAGAVARYQVEQAVASLAHPPVVILNGTKPATPLVLRRLLGIRE